jgi:hypothetical protein
MMWDQLNWYEPYKEVLQENATRNSYVAHGDNMMTLVCKVLQCPKYLRESECAYVDFPHFVLISSLSTSRRIVHQMTAFENIIRPVVCFLQKKNTTDSSIYISVSSKLISTRKPL